MKCNREWRYRIIVLTVSRENLFTSKRLNSNLYPLHAFKLEPRLLQMPIKWKIIAAYYISKLVRTLWLVDLAGRAWEHGPLKFKVVFVAKLLRDLSPNFLNLYLK